MIKVFNASDTIFSSNGDKILQPVKAVVLKEDNGEFYLDLETSIADSQYIQNDAIIRADLPQGAQNFRVYNSQKKNQKITCKCKHISFDADRYLIADAYVVDKNCNDALDHLNNATDTTSPFTMFSDIASINTYRCVRKSLSEAVTEVLNRWGGHLVRDNYNLSIRANIGQDNGVSLRYGKNITDITAAEDWSKVTTKLMPVGKDGLLLPEVYLYAETTYSTPYTRTVSFTQDINTDDYKDENGNVNEDEYNEALIADLRTQGAAFVAENQYPKVAYTVKGDISKITDVGDTIGVYHEKLGIDMTTHVTSFKYDCLQGRYIEVNFGNFTNKLSQLIPNITQDATSSIITGVHDTIVPTLDNKLQNAYDSIWGALTESFCIYEGDKILIVDQLPKEQAQYCIMINSAGISFSKNGINGQFTSAWLIDGTLNMQAINVINLTADLIKGGTLKLGSLLDQSGKIELYDDANKVVATFDKDGLIMYAKNDSYIVINPVVGFVGYDKNGKPIYWATKDEFHFNKGFAEDEFTFGGLLRAVPINTADNKGVAFVATI